MVVRRSVKHFPATDSPLLAEAQASALAPRLLWVQVLTYRPLFLLGSLWLALVCASAVAYHHLMFTEPPAGTEPALSKAEVVPSQTPTALADVDADASLRGQALAPADEAPASPPSPSNLGPAVTLWGLMSLVGLCALGCFVISQQAKATPRPSQLPKRRLKKRRASLPVVIKPTGPKRLAPYQPQRDGVIVQGGPLLKAVDETQGHLQPATLVDTQGQAPAAKLTAQVSYIPYKGGVPSVSRPPASRLGDNDRSQSQPTPSPRLRPRQELVALPALTPYQPAVVPEAEVHPLDWSEASIAHTLDLRQRHSLSSWL